MKRPRIVRALCLMPILLSACLLLAGCDQGYQRAAPDDTITIGWTAWSDAEFVTRLAQKVIEAHTDHKVHLKLAGIGRQYQGVASGQLDAMLMAWLPDTHARYWARYQDRLVDLGALYQGGRTGWVVPGYVPPNRLDTIADLAKPKVAARLDHRIQGIDPGAGEMQMSATALKTYGLDNDYDLVAANAQTMTAALAKAEHNHDWIVITGWTPHWIFAKWKLRFLADPKNVMGKPQHIDAVVRKGFRSAYPKVAAILSAVHLSLPELQAAMLDAHKTTYTDAVVHFVHQHPAQIQKWVAAGNNT